MTDAPIIDVRDLRKIYRMGSVADELQGPAAAKPQALTSSQGGSQQ